MKIDRYIMERLRRLGGTRGFSLIEVLTVIALLLVIMVAVYGVWLGMQRSYRFTDDDLKAQGEARAAMYEMVEAIRTAREPDFPVDDALDLVIVRAEDNALVCWSDVDRDDAHTLELIRFWVDTDPEERSLFRSTSTTGDITFGEGTQTRLVGHWVSNDEDPGDSLFTYVGTNGAALQMTEDLPGNPSHVVDPTKIREVHINLMVDIVLGDKPEHHVLSSVVQPRNLRLY